MADLWLPLEDRFALWDPLAEQVRVVGWRPGPAGVSSLELAPGLWASVDHASPTTLTDVTVDADGGRIADASLDVLASLLGDEATEVVRGLPAMGASDLPTPIRSRSRRGVDDLFDAEPWLPHLVLTGDLAEDADLSDLARASALLDGVLPAATLGLALAGALARGGVELLLSASLAPVRPDHRANLEQRLLHIEHLTPGAVPDLDLRRARRRLDDATARTRPAVRRAGRMPAPPPAAAAGMAPAAAAAKAAAPMEVEDAALQADVAEDRRELTGAPLAVEGDHRSWAWLDHGSHVRFQASRSAAGSWGRVYRAADRLLLGLAPLRDTADADGLRALVVIPPVHDAAQLVVDVVNDATAPRRSPTHDLTRSAVLAGRRAARLTRRGDPGADAAWQECAERWLALGDTQRANFARRHGRRDDRGSPRGRGAGAPPLLADDVR